MNAGLPEDMKMVMWIPVVHYGETYYHCRIDGFGLTAGAFSRSKPKALAFALEDLAQQIKLEAEHGERELAYVPPAVGTDSTDADGGSSASATGPGGVLGVELAGKPH